MKHGRLPWLEPQDLTEGQRGLYDRIAHGPRASGKQAFRLIDEAGRLEGPFNALLFVPEIGLAVQEVGSAIRYRGKLSDRMRELAILELATIRRTEFEWYAHERVGRAVGLDEHELHALKNGLPAPTFDPAETLVRELVRSLVTTRDIDRSRLERAETLFGEAVIMEIIALVGYYDLLALSLNVWQTPLPDGAVPVFQRTPETTEFAFAEHDEAAAIAGIGGVELRADPGRD